MAYNELNQYTSPNQSSGAENGRQIKGITIHWWGNPSNNPTFEGVVAWLCNPAIQVSAHLVVTGTGRRVAQIVDDSQIAWHAGNWEGNRTTIGIECDPRARDEDYDVIAEVVADLWRYYGKLPLYPHKHWVATACPGNYDLKRLQREAEAKLNPPKPAPKPDPKPAEPKPTPAPKITYTPITKKSIELIRDTNLWNFNFTKWADAKAVQSRKKGAVIDNIVAIATNPLGATYYVTEYSYKNKITNGFNTKDAKDYKAPVVPPKAPVTPPKTPVEPVEPPKPEPTPTPEPAPEKPVTEKPDYAEENNKLLKQILQLLTDLITKFTNIFK